MLLYNMWSRPHEVALVLVLHVAVGIVASISHRRFSWSVTLAAPHAIAPRLARFPLCVGRTFEPSRGPRSGLRCWPSPSPPFTRLHTGPRKAPPATRTACRAVLRRPPWYEMTQNHLKNESHPEKSDTKGDGKRDRVRHHVVGQVPEVCNVSVDHRYERGEDRNPAKSEGQKIPGVRGRRFDSSVSVYAQCPYGSISHHTT